MEKPAELSSSSHIHQDTLLVADHRLRRYSVPLVNPIARLILLHGYGEHAGRYLHVMQWMASRNIACHAIDFRGHGESTGRRSHISRWDEYLQDLNGLLSHPEILTPVNHSPLFVLGHSHGGLIAAAAGVRQLLPAAGVILASPFLELMIPVPWHRRIFARVASIVMPGLKVRSGVKADMLSRDEEMVSLSRADKHALGITTPRWFITTQKVQRQVRANAAAFTLPLMMLVAKEDSIANPQAAIDFHNQAGSKDKSLHEYEGFKHELLREVGREAIFEQIAVWIHARVSRS